MTAVHAQLESACPACRSSSPADTATCPACGASRLLRIDVLSTGFYNRAIAALRSEGLVRKEAAAGGGLGTFGSAYLGASPDGSIWIDAVERERAGASLALVGLDLIEAARPIVDRSDPTCPHCAARLDHDVGATCASCGGAFEWVDIDEPPFDPTGHRCSACGYELTGAGSDRCSECGEPFGHDAESLVDAATNAEATPAVPTADADVPPALRALTRLIWLTLVLALLLLAYLPLAAAGAGVVVAVLVVIRLALGSAREAGGPE